MSYKYQIIHILTGNTIGICYDGFSKKPKTYRLACWLAQKDKKFNKKTWDIINEDTDTGILGFFISDGLNTPNNEIGTFSHTNKATLKALINDFNFRFDIVMDIYDVKLRHEMFKLLKEKGKKIIPIPSEFEIVRVK